MNKKITAAVASATLALSAATANAGIIIPAGEWTLDVNGNVNIFATRSSADDSLNMTGAEAIGKEATTNEDTYLGLNTGLLPAWLGFTGTTRQNDLDVSFTISIQPNVSNNGVTGDGAADTSLKNPLMRQAFLTFGDKSWGSVKMGKDIGIFARNAILNDMTLLGVGGIGGSSKSGASTSHGGIGSGYMYAAWKGQIAYTTPNLNGFQATVGITNPNQFQNLSAGITQAQDRFGVEAEANYSWSNGKVWVSGASYKAQVDATNEIDATAVDLGATMTMGNAGLTAYVYSGDGAGTTFWGYLGNSGGKERESDGGYVQATYVIPTGTKLGVAYGVSKLDCASGETCQATLVKENKRWTVGAYHPLTKHLNLVAEYNNIESDSQGGTSAEYDSMSLGAILFF
ncbi:MAG: porin [Methylophilaceae bacterium]